MFELRFLGEVSLGVPPGPARRQLTRPRSVAMLAILAASEGDGVTRDRLVALLWESVDRGRARHSLANQLHLVRKALGTESVLTAGEFVRLNPARVSADIREFRAALEDEDLERAAGSYRGPFLRGFHLDGADEFERWTDTERQALATSALDVFEELARREAREGRPAGEVRWWQRAVRCDPWNSRAALSLAHALARSGDPGNGVQALREHVRRLAEDLQIPADPAILSLIETGDFGHAQAATPARMIQVPTSSSIPGQASRQRQEVGAGTRPSRRRRFAHGAAAALLTFALVAAAAAFVDRVGRPGGDARANRVAVLPALPVGIDSSIAEIVTVRLHSELADWKTFEAVPARAADGLGETAAGGISGEAPADGIRRLGRRLDSERVLLSRVTPSEDGVEIAGSLIGSSDGKVISTARASARIDSIGHLVHDLVVRLAAREVGIPDDRVATLGGQDHEAVRLFIRAHPHESEQGNRLLREAIARDSTFALAALELYESFEGSVNQSDPTDPTAESTLAAWQEIADLVWENRDRLSPADRAYAEARLGWRFADAYTARLQVAAWERAVEVAPDRLDHWQGLFHACYTWCSSYAGHWQGPLLDVFDAILERGDTTDIELATELAVLAGDSARLGAYAGLLPPDAWYGRWLVGLGLGRESDRAAVVAKFPELGNSPLMRIGNFAILTGLALEDAEREAEEPQRGKPGSIYALRQAVLARERGRHAEYRRLRDKMFQIFDVHPGLDALAAANVIAEWATFGEPETEETLDAMDRMLTGVVSREPTAAADTLAVAHCYRSWLRLERGDATDVSESVHFLEMEPSVRGLALARMCAPFLSLLAARGEGREGLLRAAQRLFEAVRDRPVTLGQRAGTSYTDLYIASAANLELGRAFGELGYPETGVQVVERRPIAPAHWGLYGYHVDFVREEARLLAQAGETEAARARYARYFRLRPEPPDLASWATEWEEVKAEYEALWSAAG